MTPVCPVLLAFRRFPGELRLGTAGACGYTLPAMNETIKPGPEIPLQATGLPHLSVVVPTFNERDNVTTLYKRLEATFGAHAVGSRVRRRQFA